MLQVEHDCEIKNREEDVLFLPGRGICQRLIHCFRLSLMASRKNPAALKVLRSTASIVQEKRRQLRTRTYVIHPFSMFRCATFVIVITESGPYFTMCLCNISF